MYVEEGTDWIPKRVRAYIYRGLTVVLGLNAVFGFIPDGVVAKIVAAASVFGFGLASVYTSTKSY
jgi:hypothetical protein